MEDRIQERRVISSHQRCRTRSGRVPWKLRVPRTKRVTAQNVIGAASKEKTKKKPWNVAIELQRVTATGDGDGSCSQFRISKKQMPRQNRYTRDLSGRGRGDSCEE